MICNISNGSNGRILLGSKAIYFFGLLKDLDVGVVNLCKSADLLVVCVGSILIHILQVFPPRMLDLLLCDILGRLRGVGAGVLSLWVSTSNLVYMNERFEVFGVLAHVSNYSLADIQVFALVSVKLVRESVEETVAYRNRRSISFYRSNDKTTHNTACSQLRRWGQARIDQDVSMIMILGHVRIVQKFQ